MLHVICTPLWPGHLSVRVGDSSRRSEEIVKFSNCASKCDYYYYSVQVTDKTKTGESCFCHSRSGHFVTRPPWRRTQKHIIQKRPNIELFSIQMLQRAQCTACISRRANAQTTHFCHTYRTFFCDHLHSVINNRKH